MPTLRTLWLLVLVAPHLWGQAVRHWKTTPAPADSLWNNAANWEEGAVPGSADTAYVNNCTVCPYLTSTVTTVARLEIYNSRLKIADKKMVIGLLNMYTTTLTSNNGTLEVYNAPNITISHFYGPVTLHIHEGYFKQQNQFHSPVTIEASPSVSQKLYIGTGDNNIFHEETVLLNRSDGGWDGGIHVGVYGTGILFKKKCTFINQNAGGHNLLGSNENATKVIFEGAAEIDQQSASGWARIEVIHAEFQKTARMKGQGGQINIAVGAVPSYPSLTVTFKDTLSLAGQNTSFYFGKGGNLAMLNTTSRLRVASSGLSQCEITLDKFQYKNTTTSLSFDASVYGGSPAQNTVSITANADFEGAVTLKAADLKWTGGTFRKAATLHRSASTNSVNNVGGAVFMDTTHLINQSNRSWTVGNDTYQKNARFTHAGDNTDNRLYLSHTHPDTFYGHLLFSSTATASPAGGIWLGDGLSSSDSVPVPLGKSLQTQSWSRGWLSFKRVFQPDGTPQTLTLTGNSRANFDDCEFYGQLNLTAPHWYIQYARFRGISSFTKTGTGSDEMLGVNFFHTKTQFINQAPAGNTIRFIHRNDIVR